MPLNFSTFPCSDNSFMRWAWGTPVVDAKGTIVILPGWGEWLEKYAEIAAEWQQRGFNTVLVEWRGQGLSARFIDNRAVCWMPSFDHLLDDFDAFFVNETRRDKGPIYLLGHSMGAHLALRWWMEGGHTHQKIKGLILLSPMQEIITAPFPLPVAKFLARAATALGFGKHAAFGHENFDQAAPAFDKNFLTHDEARYRNMIIALRENPALKVGGASFGWLKAAFDSCDILENELKNGAPLSNYLVLGANDDPLVTTNGMKKIASLLPNCQSHYFENAKHELLFERDDVRTLVWEKIDGFLET